MAIYKKIEFILFYFLCLVIIEIFGSKDIWFEE